MYIHIICIYTSNQYLLCCFVGCRVIVYCYGFSVAVLRHGQAAAEEHGRSLLANSHILSCRAIQPSVE